MAHERILIIEDDTDIQALLKERLNDEQFAVFQAFSGEEGLSLCKTKKPDIIVLDIMLPNQNGFDVLRTLKTSPTLHSIPVLMLTARSDETDIVTALELGADDYVTKPFSFRVLLARIRRFLRHTLEPEKLPALLHYGALEVDRSKFLVSCNGNEITLSATEFSMLCLFMEQPGRVFTRPQIITAIKGEDYPVTDRTIDVHVTSLRKKLGDYFPLETIRGIGYRLKEQG